MKGRHHQLLGTEMIFSEDKGANSPHSRLFEKADNSAELHRRSIQHVANTEQRILFKEVTLQPRSTELSKTSDGTAQNSVQDIDGQRIDRMTGKAAPLTRAPRARGSSKKKAGDLENKTAQASKGKEKQAIDSDFVSPSMDLDQTFEKDST